VATPPQPATKIEGFRRPAFTIAAPSMKHPKPTATEPQPEPERYEDALSELERLVQAMEGGSLPLDGLLDNYRRGAELLELCRKRLNAVEVQVKVLEDGQLKDWVAS
jgi:exodeoxyribonuclease VII small subunit